MQILPMGAPSGALFNFISPYDKITAMRTVHLENENDTKKFAEELAETLSPGDVIALIGDLGTGKTTLTKYLAKALGVTETVTSPTFNIVKEYRSGRLPLFHFDVYRIEDPDEMYEIGFEEYLYAGGVCVIEWADRIEELLPEDAKIIYMERGAVDDERIYQCTF